MCRQSKNGVGGLRAGFFLGVMSLSVAAALLGAADENEACPIDQAECCCNGLPNTSARFRPGCTTFTTFADLLVWRAEESGSENWAEVISSSGLSTTCEIRDVRFEWNAGFRVGVGLGLPHDEWDTELYYTWFRTRGSDHVSDGPGSIFSSYIGNFYVDNPTGAGISGVAYQKASVNWTIHFNLFDWELGRAFWVSRSLSIRPFIGIKGGWIDQSIHTKWQNPHLPANELFSTATENLKNDFWGLGPSGGLDTKWDLYACQNHSFSLFGDFSGSIMYGHWTFGDVYKNDIQQEVSIKLSNINSGATMLRAFMGFEWDATLCQDQFHFSTRLGYEMQFWLDQLQFYSFDTGRLSNELTLQGGTLDFRFEF